MNLIKKIKNYFTPSKVKELEEKVNQLQRNAIQNVLQPIKTGSDFDIDKKIEKIISKILYNTNTKNIYVILKNGNTLSGIVEKEVYAQIKECNDELVLVNLLSPPKKIEEENGSDFDIEVEKIITPLINILSSNSNFEIENNKVYLKGIKSIAIPSSIVAYFISLLENINNTSNINEINNLKEQFEIIKLFTLKLLANPIEESRNTLLNFVKTNHVQLTPSGNICLYRRFVTKKSGNKELESFVTQRYLKIKQNKKSPSNYNIFLSDNNYFTKNKDIIKLENAEFIGNLNEIYRNLQKVTDIIYTDNHTQSYSISIPGIYKIREQDIDKNRNGSCGGFLHAASLDFDYSSFGDQDTLVIINPMNAAKMDTGVKSKIGVTEMYVACTIDKNCKNIKDLDFINFDTEYEKLTLEEIKSALNNKSLQSFSITDEVTSFNYQNLQTLKEILEKRIIKI